MPSFDGASRSCFSHVHGQWIPGKYPCAQRVISMTVHGYIVFTAHQVQNYLNTISVTHFTTQGESKSNYAERVIRTLRSLMHRFMKKKRSLRYIDKLQTLVSNYNRTPHRALGYKSPTEIDETNEVDQIISQYFPSPPVKWKTKKSRNLVKRSSFRFKVGDTVHISHFKHVFEREFMEKFTGEVFKIKDRFMIIYSHVQTTGFK